VVSLLGKLEMSTVSKMISETNLYNFILLTSHLKQLVGLMVHVLLFTIIFHHYWYSVSIQ